MSVFESSSESSVSTHYRRTPEPGLMDSTWGSWNDEVNEVSSRVKAKAREYYLELRGLFVDDDDIKDVYEMIFSKAKLDKQKKIDPALRDQYKREKRKLRAYIRDTYGPSTRISQIPGLRARFTLHMSKLQNELDDKLIKEAWIKIDDKRVAVSDILDDRVRPTVIAGLREIIDESYRQLREWYLEEDDDITSEDVAKLQASLTLDEHLLRIALRVQTMKMRAF